MHRGRFPLRASSEKQGIGFFCDGRASLVVGTHTHVPTADHQILSGGTAYMTDAGMTAIMIRSSACRRKSRCGALRRAFLGPVRTALGTATLSGVAVETDDETGLALRIAPVRIAGGSSRRCRDFGSQGVDS